MYLLTDQLLLNRRKEEVKMLFVNDIQNQSNLKRVRLCFELIFSKKKKLIVVVLKLNMSNYCDWVILLLCY